MFLKLSLNTGQTAISCSLIRPVNCHGITDMARAKNQLLLPTAWNLICELREILVIILAFLEIFILIDMSALSREFAVSKLILGIPSHVPNQEVFELCF